MVTLMASPLATMSKGSSARSRGRRAVIRSFSGTFPVGDVLQRPLVVLGGGTVRTHDHQLGRPPEKEIRRRQCTVGETAVGKLADLRADVAFMGTNGITPNGFTTRDEDEASVKRAMGRAGQRVVVLAGSSELDQETLVRFAAPEDVDVLITELSGERPPRRRGRCRRRR